MFSVTVRDHLMVAHSFTGANFGPAQRLHGATFVVDATFRRDELEFAGINTTTEELARVVTDRLADRVMRGLLGESAQGLVGIAVTLHESHIAWATFERAL